MVLAAFPIAGLRWHLVWYLKIAVAAREIGHGLTGLGNILVPYDGFDHRVTLVVMLGAAVLLLDAGAVLAFAPRRISDARRATAALPLIALAVVPSTLVHPTAPSLQGLLLFVLVAFFVWGERLRFDGGRAGTGAAGGWRGSPAAVVAPVINGGKPWFDYRSGAAATSIQHLASFQWNQTYGPLRWPQKGSEVLSVRAKTGHYWKAENLDDFDGTAWVQGPPTLLPVAGAAGGAAISAEPLPAPSPAAVRRYSETVRVTIQGMRTTDLIGAGQWTLDVTDPGRQPPRPGHRRDRRRSRARTGRRLSGAGLHAEAVRASAQRRDGAAVPMAGAARVFDGRRSRRPAARSVAGPVRALPCTGRSPPSSASSPSPARSRTSSDRHTAGRTQLAQQLASESHNELQFVRQVMAYLSTGNGFRYDQTPPRAQYPLDLVPVQDQARLLPAVLRGDGAAAADGRRPGAGRDRLHDRQPRRPRRHVPGRRHRRPRLGRGLVPDLRLGHVRSHAGQRSGPRRRRWCRPPPAG